MNIKWPTNTTKRHLKLYKGGAILKIDSDKVKFIMAEQLLTIKGLSKRADVSIYTISRALNNKSDQTPVTIGKLSQALKTPIDQIIKTE